MTFQIIFSFFHTFPVCFFTFRDNFEFTLIQRNCTVNIHSYRGTLQAFNIFGTSTIHSILWTTYKIEELGPENMNKFGPYKDIKSILNCLLESNKCNSGTKIQKLLLENHSCMLYAGELFYPRITYNHFHMQFCIDIIFIILTRTVLVALIWNQSY